MDLPPPPPEASEVLADNRDTFNAPSEPAPPRFVKPALISLAVGVFFAAAFSVGYVSHDALVSPIQRIADAANEVHERHCQVSLETGVVDSAQRVEDLRRIVAAEAPKYGIKTWAISVKHKAATGIAAEQYRVTVAAEVC